MDWLAALLFLLALGALAGLLWLHFGRSPVAQPPGRARGAGSELSGLSGDDAALSITLSYLRQRASHYRDVALKVEDPVAGARCWDLARMLERTAEALEHPPEEEPPARED